MNLERFKYRHKYIKDDSTPDVIPETPPKCSISISISGQKALDRSRSGNKRKLVTSSEEDDQRHVNQKRKKTRITHFLKEKPKETKSASTAFFSPDSGSDDETQPERSSFVGQNGHLDDIKNKKVDPIHSQEDSQNSVASSTDDSPLFKAGKYRNRFRLDSNEVDSPLKNNKSSSKRLGLSSSESESEDVSRVTPRGPFPRLNCGVSNSTPEGENEVMSDPAEDVPLSNGDSRHTKKSFYSEKSKSWKHMPHDAQKKKKHRSKKLEKFNNDCLNEDNAVDENFSMDMDYSSDDEDEFCHLGRNKKRNILEFFENATEEELFTIHTCSTKKAGIIVKLRPFGSWNDLADKMDKTKHVTSDLISHCADLLKERAILQSLLADCHNISDKLNSELESLRLKDHMTKGKMVVRSPTCIPSNLVLKPYQLVGLNWIALLHRNSVNGVLADEMGLGKTIQTISFLAHLLDDNPKTGPHLIVVPSSTLDNWMREFSMWCPSMDVVLYRGSQVERRSIRAEFLHGNKTANVILTTYNSAISSPEDRVFFRKISLDYAVFDEGHMLKNMSSQRYTYLMKIKASRRLLLTGTPLQNNLLELMSLLRFVMPHMFEQTTDSLVRIFSSSNADNTSTFAQERIKDAKEIMQPFVLRRLKDDVLKQLPDKENEILYCEMTSEQTKQYEETKERYRLKLHKKSTSELKNVFIELRKVANHTLLRRKHYTMEKLTAMAKLLKKDPEYHDSREALIVEDMQVMTDFELDRFCRTTNAIRKYALDGDLLFNSGKFRKLDSLLPKFKQMNERVVIFSQFTMIMDIIELYLQRRSHRFARLDGSTPVSRRLDIIDEFNKDSSIFIFLLSTKAGGLGINLTSANVVILHDIDMNPYNDKQAEDRCHRLGQTRKVKIIRMLSKGTIEEGMLRCAQNKLKLEQEMTGAGDDGASDIASLLHEALAS